MWSVRSFWRLASAEIEIAAVLTVGGVLALVEGDGWVEDGVDGFGDIRAEVEHPPVIFALGPSFPYETALVEIQACVAEFFQLGYRRCVVGIGDIVACLLSAVINEDGGDAIELGDDIAFVFLEVAIEHGIEEKLEGGIVAVVVGFAEEPLDG